MRVLGWSLCWLAAINVATYSTFARDKRAAEAGAWRVPESTLLSMAAIGGIIGAMAAQRRLRHKTKKQPFASFLLLIAGLQILFVLAMLVPDFRSHVWMVIEQAIGQ